MKKTTLFPNCMLTFLGAVLLASSINAAPALVNYQGRLTNSSGANLSSGTCAVEFRIWDAQVGGNLVWGAIYSNIAVKDGFFNVLLGSENGGVIAGTLVNSLNEAFNGTERFIGLTVVNDGNGPVDGPTEIARQQITTSPYAFRAATADQAAVLGNGQSSKVWLSPYLPGVDVLQVQGAYLSVESDIHGAEFYARGNVYGTEFRPGKSLFREGFLEVRIDGQVPGVDFSNDGTTDYDARLLLIHDDLLELQGAYLNVQSDIHGSEFYARGRVYAAGFTETSDARLKENINSLSNAMASVERLRGVSYDWKDGRNTTGQVGLIAQEVREVVPSAVTERSDGVLGINYSSLIPLLIEAVKEQQAEIQELRRLIGEKR